MDASPRRQRPPNSTYRLQLGPDRTLDDAAELVGYLHRMGVGALYLSPVLTAAPGSTHGYDVADPTRVSPALGGAEAWRRLADRAREAGLAVVVDIVPNHMAVAPPQANPWWADVLRHGRESPRARFFDIDWGRGPLLVPVLGDDGDGGTAALEQLALDGEWLVYHEHRFPIAPGTHRPGDDALAVHERQHYRLVSWRRGDTELAYRRFFDVTELAAVRVEDPAVFADTHAEILRWLHSGEAAGLRIDHPDGLADPGAYLRRLRDEADCWLVVEKILGVGESPPASWPVDGTTGYDALREVCGVFIDPAGEGPMTGLAKEWGVPTDFAALETECRRTAATTALAAEVRRIAALFPGSAAGRVREAVAELLAAFPAYRSYLPEGEQVWAAAVAAAAARRGDLADVLADIDRRVRAAPEGEPARRIQQTSGMVVAKGTEDTALYRYSRFVALNEVGGAPDRFGVSLPEFHHRAAAREAAWPATMTALSTHDTKRSEDVRARLAVLAEIPEEFAALVRRWNQSAGLSEPSLDLLAWQTLVGAWPISAERLRGYLLKAAREAKVRTSWVDGDPGFEEEVAAWPQRVLGDPSLSSEVAALVDRIREAGWSNSLGQKIVQLTAPGIPDVYQGTELWDHSLVDPDNRRPVDFARRRLLLDRLDRGWLPPVDAGGAAKLHVVRSALRLRAERAAGGYRPLPAAGPVARHVLAFARGGSRGHDIVTVATRLPLGLAAAGGWRDTTLSLPGGAGQWWDRLTGRLAARDHGADAPARVGLAELLQRYPVALLVRD